MVHGKESNYHIKIHYYQSSACIFVFYAIWITTTSSLSVQKSNEIGKENRSD